MYVLRLAWYQEMGHLDRGADDLSSPSVSPAWFTSPSFARWRRMAKLYVKRDEPLRGCRTVKFDPSNNLGPSVYTVMVLIIGAVHKVRHARGGRGSEKV